MEQFFQRNIRLRHLQNEEIRRSALMLEKKLQKDLNNNSPHLGYKPQLKQSPFLFTSFYENNGKRGENGNLDNFGPFLAS